MPTPRAAATVLLLLALAGGCGPTDTDRSGTAPTPPTPPTASGRQVAPGDPAGPRTPSGGPDRPTAAAQLARLAVKGRAPMTGYDRDRFGQAWLDADRNGCDTRNDALATHLSDVVLDPDTRGCVVTSGTLLDPYTGERIDFVRGDGTLVDVDHVVALGNAWVTGAFGWGIRKRAAFANDPMNLLPVDASANRSKSDGDAATWLPPLRASRCAYVARQVGVKVKYGLWVTPAERAAVERVLDRCPGRLVAPDSGAPVRVDQRIDDPGDPAAAEGGAYASCDAARAAGATPVRRGDPGYGPHLDGDGDGVACE